MWNAMTNEKQAKKQTKHTNPHFCKSTNASSRENMMCSKENSCTVYVSFQCGQILAVWERVQGHVSVTRWLGSPSGE